MSRKIKSAIVKYWKSLAFIVLLFCTIWAILQWLILPGYSVAWTGFGDFTNPSNEFVRGKTFWDWLELFIIPIALGIGAFFLNRSERESDRQRAEERAKVEREIAIDRQRETALQSYIDRMADLLLHEKLRTTANEEVRDVARTRTLSVLRGLDANRKTLLFRFLVEAKLIGIKKPVIELHGADLSGAFLRANLTGANMTGADLTGVTLTGVTLTGADLTGVTLAGADLRSANLSGAELFFADLTGADLSGADLSGADLNRAKVNNEQLESALSLKNATMPDGTKHG